MQTSRSLGVCVVHDHTNRGVARDLAVDLGAPSLELPLSGRGALAGYDAAIIVIDLSDFTSVREAKSALAGGDGTLTPIFAIEPGERQHANKIQANALGSHGHLQRPLRRDQVVSALAALGRPIGAADAVPRARAEASIAAAADLLGGPSARSAPARRSMFARR